MKPAPARSVASPRGGRDDLQADRKFLAGEAHRDGDRRAATMGDRIGDRQPVDIVSKFMPVAFGEIALLDRKGRDDGRRDKQQIIGLEEIERPR